jgi:predicted ribosomally synthesized peptide with SipW-like signal peptide
MAERKLYNLSRRRVLAGIGAVGLASTGAGLGTSAYFNDVESFEGNSLEAGELDLRVGWQQTYHGPYGTVPVNAHPDPDGDGWQSYGNETYTDGSANLRLDCADWASVPDTPDFDSPERSGDYGGPVEQESLIALRDVKPGDKGELTFSLLLCDNPGYVRLSGGAVEGSDSEGTNTEPENATAPTQLVPDPAGGDGDLDDLIDVRLWYDDDCDNTVSSGDPVDVMLTIDVSGSMFYTEFGGDDDVAQSTLTAGGTVGGVDYGYERVYGAGNTQNLSGDVVTKIDLVEAAAKRFVGLLADQSAPVRVGAVFFDGQNDGDTDPRVILGAGLTTLDPVGVDSLVGQGGALDYLRETLDDVVTGPTTAEDSGSADADTPDPTENVDIAEGTFIGEGIDRAQQEIADNATAPNRVNIVLTDAQSFTGQAGGAFADPADAADGARGNNVLVGDSDVESPPTDLYGIAVQPNPSNNPLPAMSGPAGSSGGDADYYFEVDDPVAIPSVFGAIGNVFAPEQVFYEGTLAELLADVEGDGVPLDAVATLAGDFGELDGANPDARDPFRPNRTYCVGFEWELPIEVGNEVQGDRIAFDLGFVAEQSRHNTPN